MFAYLKCNENLPILAIILKAICLASLWAQDLNTEYEYVSSDWETDLAQTFHTR